MIGTFVNNFLTLVPISALCVGLGYWMLGMELREGFVEGLGHAFGEAGRDIWHNVWAIFGPETMEWGGLREFFRDVFWPYLVGGIVPGLVGCAGPATPYRSPGAGLSGGPAAAPGERLGRLRGRGEG
jgi:uncharacterized protein (DUF2062 family)